MSNRLISAYNNQRGRPRPPSSPRRALPSGSGYPSQNDQTSNSGYPSRNSQARNSGHPRDQAPIEIVSMPPAPRHPATRRLPEFLRNITRTIKKDVEQILMLSFTFDEPITIEHLCFWADSEIGWTPATEVADVTAAGGLRFQIWTRKLPNPELHYTECIKRMPYLNKCPDGRSYFVRHARAQHEIRDGGCTHRCPFCQSSLLGYPMSDHTRQDCPFNVIDDEDRARFLAVNNMAFCPECNCRSPYHVKCDPRHTFYCRICKQHGHTTTEAFCGLDIGRPDEQSRDDLQQLVHDAREDVFIRVRELAQSGNPKKRCLYKIHMDHSHTQTIRNNAKGMPILGWGPYIDVDPPQYLELPSRSYGNFGTGEPTHYDALSPVEFVNNNALPIIHMDTEIHSFLSNVAEILDVIKTGADPETLDISHLIRQSERLAALSAARRAEGPAIFNRVAEQPVYPPRREAPAAQPQQRPLTRPTQQRPLTRAPQQRPLTKPPQSSRHNIGNPQSIAHRSGSQQRQPTQQWQQNDGYDRSSGYAQQTSSQVHTESSSRHALSQSFGERLSSSQPGPSNTYQNENRGNQTLPVFNDNVHMPLPEQDRAGYPHHDQENHAGYPNQDQENGAGYPNDPNDSNNSFDEREELNWEKALNRKVLALCRSSIPVGDAPARVIFPMEAHDLVVASKTPSTPIALVSRIRTLQLLLTATYEIQDWGHHSIEDLQKYEETLMLWADFVRDEPLLIVQLEEHTVGNVVQKFWSGADITKIPSYTLSKTDAFIEAFEEMKIARHQQKLHRIGSEVQHRWIPAPERRNAPNGIQALDLVNTETKLMDRFRIEAHCKTSVYLQSRTLLHDLLAHRPPHGAPAAMRLRIVHALKLLTGKSIPPLPEIPETDTLHAYYRILQGAMKLVYAIRTINGCKTVIKVRTTGCLEELAALATGLHDVTLPDIQLFELHPEDYWVAWLDVIWRSLYNEAETFSCRCQN
ncbi:hypothetical protein CAEBREN_12960 [Caenorhabditis brenneri]|uniref:Uncharacterized protein n=1 Tax=Caenorhabditis brenneri TaxID=135651 RepID=G0P581_CAEBE|nr:hypothetical protein CAEBREN_12960 [Caenorhabditis brenneri]